MTNEQPPRMINASHDSAALNDELRRQQYGPSQQEAPPIEVQRYLRRVAADWRAKRRRATQTPPAPAARPRRGGRSTSTPPDADESRTP